jgi:hypothetical protein
LAVFLTAIPFLLGVGLSARFLFMALTGHNDALFIPWISYPIQQGHWQIYDYMMSVRASETGRLASIN